MKQKNFLLIALRVACGSVLLFAGFAKIMQPPEETAAAFDIYRIFPAALLMPAATIIPWMEYLVGGFLVAGFKTRYLAAAASAIFFMFLTVLIAGLARGLNIADCGCFGNMGVHLEPRQTMILDAAMLLAALWLFKQEEHPLSLDLWVEK